MINVTALTSGRDDPASRFRIRQFIEPLKSLGVNVTEYYPFVSKYARTPFAYIGLVAAGRARGLLHARRSDITWVGRELISGRRTFEFIAGRKRLFDVDDAIWLTNNARFSERIAAESSGVIAGNEFLAAHYRPYNARVWIVPTTVDTDTWTARSQQSDQTQKWTVGWTGTWGNLPFLYDIEEPLADFLGAHRDARLLVVCDRQPTFAKIQPDSWRFVKWSEREEKTLMQTMNVGLMPLPDTDWARGKCAFKMLLYMAQEIPVVVSPVGANLEVLAHGAVGYAAAKPDDWLDALENLYRDRDHARRLGENGRRVVGEHYSVARHAATLAGIFQIVAGED